jgi:hypothetical protein
MDNDELVIEACGGGSGNCNALWDKTTSVVSIPSALAQGSNNNPTDPELLETACYSNMAEDFMVEKYEQDEMFWDNYNAQPSWTYYGAHNGLFRKIPAVYEEACGNYDPRRRKSLKVLIVLSLRSNTHNTFHSKVHGSLLLAAAQKTL